MKVIGNIIWVVFGGFIWALVLALLGVLCCITIIGIPLGLQVFKLARFVLFPFGRTIKKVRHSGLRSVLNIVWAILFGWELALGHLITGLIFCITIVGIPFGMKYFEIAKFSLLPLGRDVVRA